MSRIAPTSGLNFRNWRDYVVMQNNVDERKFGMQSSKKQSFVQKQKGTTIIISLITANYNELF